MYSLSLSHPSNSFPRLPILFLRGNILLELFLLCVCVCVYLACGILVPQPRMEPVAPAEESWSLNRWTTRESPRPVSMYDIVLGSGRVFK